MKTNKYIYYKVIQGNYSYGWSDEDFHGCASDYIPKNWQAFKDNLKSYRENGGGVYRVVKRRELLTNE